MSSGNPFKKLSMRPPSAAPVKSMTEEEGAKNLEALDEWTEKPAKEIANAIGQGAEKAVEKVFEVEAAAEQIVEPPKKVVIAKKAQMAMPWENATGIKSMTFRLPAELAEKLKYLGGTIYGETINSVATAALEKEVKRLLKERHEQQQQLNGV